jgi:propanol-preferring alcohol dehydrogenase
MQSDVDLLQIESQLHENWAEKYTLGHEGCGEILQLGSQVNDTRFKKGTVIAILSVPGCGEASCLECSSGLPQLCKVRIFSGRTIHR